MIGAARLRRVLGDAQGTDAVLARLAVGVDSTAASQRLANARDATDLAASTLDVGGADGVCAPADAQPAQTPLAFTTFAVDGAGRGKDLTHAARPTDGADGAFIVGDAGPTLGRVDAQAGQTHLRAREAIGVDEA